MSEENANSTHQDTSSRDHGMTLINTFHVRPGRVDEFLLLQMEEAARLGEAARAKGWRGNLVLRAPEANTAIIITVFESAEAKRAWVTSGLFAEHLNRVGPLVVRVDSKECELVAKHGSL